MKILIIASWYPDSKRPGRGIFFKEQAEMLARHGHNVSVIIAERFPMSYAMVAHGEFRKALFRKPVVQDQGQVKVYSINKYFLLPSRYFGPLLIPIISHDVQQLFYQYVREQGLPDVIHAHSAIHAGFCAARFARRHDLPLVVTEHRSNYLHSKLTWIQRAETLYCARRTSKLVFVSERLRDCFLAHTAGIGSKKAHIVNNMVSPDFFETNIKQERGKDFIFCSVGHLVPIKQHDRLIEAFELAFRDDPNVKLRIVGEGPEREELNEKIQNAGMSGKVQLVGYLPKGGVIGELSRCDAFVLASKKETFGLSIAEATAMGLPCIATDCGGPSEIINPDNGYLVPVDDVEALANALRGMIAGAANFNRSFIRQQCKNRFGENAILIALENIFAEAGK